MILGTVQLGLEYGINNSIGKPSENEAYSMLEYAYNNGIELLDTASSYGDAECIIGNYIKKSCNLFKICTKLPVILDEKQIQEYCINSLDKLNVNSIEVLYLHRFEQCKNETVMLQMRKLKKKKLIKNMGISIYEPEELEYIIENIANQVDVVQLPFNLFDNSRWFKNSLLVRAKNKGICLYARSLYLQGLFFFNPENKRIKEKGLTEYSEFINKKAIEHNLSIEELSISFVKSCEYFDDFLLGAETKEQVERNIQANKNSKKFSKDVINEIVKKCRTIPLNAIDPRKW